LQSLGADVKAENKFGVRPADTLSTSVQRALILPSHPNETPMPLEGGGVEIVPLKKRSKKEVGNSTK
jgi:hypothetical protein